MKFESRTIVKPEEAYEIKLSQKRPNISIELNLSQKRPKRSEPEEAYKSLLLSQKRPIH